MGLMQGLGRSITNIGSSRAKLAGVAAVAGTAGLLGSLPGTVVDAGNEVAFGDENADKYCLGERGLSAGTVFDSTLGPGVAVVGTAAGGAIGLVKDGDIIDIDIPNRSINVRISDNELENRRKEEEGKGKS